MAATSTTPTPTVPAGLWAATVLTIILATIPLIGVAYGLASIPHSGRGCELQSGPICGDQAENLSVWTFLLVITLLMFVIWAGILNIANFRRYSPRQRALPPLAIVSFCLVVLGIATAIFKSQ